MAYQPVPNTAQLDMVFTLSAARAQNSLYFLKPDGWDPAELDTLINTVETWWQGGPDSLMTLEAALTFMRAVDLTSLDTQIRTKSMNHPGGSPLPAAPVNATWAIKFDTGKRGRGRAGRNFYPFPSEDAIDAYTIPAAAADAIIGYYNDLGDAVAAALPNALWVVVHRYRDGVKLQTATTDPVLSAVAGDYFLDSQKNRLPNHRRQKRAPAQPA